VGAAALPGGAVEDGGDGGLEALVGVGDHQLHPREAPGHQAPQERRPAGAVLDGDHVDAEHLPVAGGVDAGGAHHGHVLDPAVLPHPLDQGVDPHVGVGAGVEGPVAEGLDHGVEGLGHLADLGLRQRLDAQGPGHVLHPAGGDSLQVALGHHRHQGPLGSAPGLEQPIREVAAGAQLGDVEVDGAGPGVEGPGPVAVAPVGSILAALAPARAAQGVGLGGHELFGEGLHHLSDQVVAALVVEVFAQPGQGVHLVGDHRTPFRFVCRRTS